MFVILASFWVPRKAPNRHRDVFGIPSFPQAPPGAPKDAIWLDLGVVLESVSGRNRYQNDTRINDKKHVICGDGFRHMLVVVGFLCWLSFGQFLVS